MTKDKACLTSIYVLAIARVMSTGQPIWTSGACLASCMPTAVHTLFPSAETRANLAEGRPETGKASSAALLIALLVGLGQARQ